MIGPENTTIDVRERAGELAILGVGSFEQHSSHLPLETDFFFAREVSRSVAEKIDAILLNPLPYSTSLEHRDFAGTVTLRPETLRRMVCEIAESVASWSIKYLALINFHGGNFILNPAAREWNMDKKLPHIMVIDYWASFPDMFPNLHAGEVETSLMLHLAPHKVKTDLPEDYVPGWAPDCLTHFGMKGVSPTGLWGFPSKATAEKGEKWLRQSVDYCTGRIEKLIKHYKSLE